MVNASLWMRSGATPAAAGRGGRLSIHGIGPQRKTSYSVEVGREEADQLRALPCGVRGREPGRVRCGSGGR